MESPKPSRADCVTDAFAVMGITSSAAITSLGASGMLFACYVQTFFKFGGVMFMTISPSFVFANCYFMPLLAWVGPEGTFAATATRPTGRRRWRPSHRTGGAGLGEQAARGRLY